MRKNPPNFSFFRDAVRSGAACALLLASLSGAQSAKPALLKHADLDLDVSVLRRAYETLHPGLYRYNSKAQMDAAFAALSLRLDHDETLQDAFLAFSEFAAKVRCGHTQANPLNQPNDIIETLFRTPTRVPFYFVWIDRRMIVTEDFSADHSFPAGTEIVAIDGVSVTTILSKLLTVARADGANDSKRMAQLAVTGESEYETFDIYYPMFFPLAQGRFAFTIRLPGSKGATQRSAEPLTFEQRIARIKQREHERKGGSDALFEARSIGDGSLYIKMPTWAMYDSKWDWKRWLNQTLDHAAEDHAPGIILDLRGNEGGDDVGNEILPHLIDEPMSLSPMLRLVRYRKVPDELVSHLDTWDKGFFDWGASAVSLQEPWLTAPNEVPYLKLMRSDGDAPGDVIKPGGKRFHGKVIVLIDASNSSATFQFVQIMQAHHLGVLVGQATGGSQRGINGGAFFFLRLPHSGIELDLPLIGTFPPIPAPDAGVTPDILVTRSASNIANKRDPELAIALGLCGRPGAAK